VLIPLDGGASSPSGADATMYEAESGRVDRDRCQGSGSAAVPAGHTAEYDFPRRSEVDFTLEEDAVPVEPRRGRPTLRGEFAGLALTAALEADRRGERGR